jgi:hypothetical protein
MSVGFDQNAYIAAVRWQYATTMPQWPHEYTVRTWRPDLDGDFEDFCRLIQDRGVVEPWPVPPERAIYHNSYIVVGSWKYWAMGPLGDQDTAEEKTVIN